MVTNTSFEKFSASRSLLLLVFSLAIVLANSPSAMPQDQDSGSEIVVRMTNELKFVPDHVTVKVGQTVEWVNELDGPIHTVTTNPDSVADPNHVAIPKGAKPFDSGIIKSGKSFRYKFATPGVYRYVCQPHESMMRGEVTVTE